MEAIHEYMCEKVNDSDETVEERKIRHVVKRKLKYTKEQTERNPRTKEQLELLIKTRKTHRPLGFALMGKLGQLKRKRMKTALKNQSQN